MSTIITRDEAKKLINSVFATFAVSPSPDPIRDSAEAIRFKQGLATLVDLHEKPDYKEALEALSMEGFTEYFNLIGSFWKLMGGDSAKKFTNVRLVSAKTLGEDIAKAQNAKKLSALVNGFNPQEITGLTYAEKLSAIKRILDDWCVLDDKENALLTLIGAMDENERKTLQKDLLQGSNALLKKLLFKIDGPEKLSTYNLFATILSSAAATGEQILIPDGQRVHASFWKDTIKLTSYIDSQNLGSIKQKDYTVSPFSMIEYQQGTDTLRIPAFFFTDANTLAEYTREKRDGKKKNPLNYLDPDGNEITAARWKELNTRLTEYIQTRNIIQDKLKSNNIQITKLQRDTVSNHFYYAKERVINIIDVAITFGEVIKGNKSSLGNIAQNLDPQGIAEFCVDYKDWQIAAELENLTSSIVENDNKIEQLKNENRELTFQAKVYTDLIQSVKDQMNKE